MNFRVSDSAAFPFLEETEEFHLKRQWDLPDFIEEECATISRRDVAEQDMEIIF